jgi:hypothetical protein
MRATWSALHLSLIRHLNCSTSDEEYQAMRQQFPELAPLPSIPALLEHQHGQTAPAEARHLTLRTLVLAAQTDASFRPVAQMMVVMALWPGLDAVLGRLARGFPGEREGLPGEIIARIGTGIATLDLTRVTAVTATLIRNVERDIRRELIADRVRARAMSCIHEPEIEAAATLWSTAAPTHGRGLAEWLALLSPADATLLDRIFRLGETQEAAGRALDLGPTAARKRVQRAIRSLRQAAEK